jgi:hypothetical protein
MTRARERAVAIGLAVLALIALVALATAGKGPSASSPPRGVQARKLLLITSLPIIFNEDFSLAGGGSPVLNKLRAVYRVAPISVTSPAELTGANLLLMAHAPAQTAENLVALDDWVRRGGHVLVLADPLLEWPSKRPLGDRLRPSPMFMDTGLLAHWGLRLDTPGKRGQQVRKLGSYRVVTVSPGQLAGTCEVRDEGLDARCAIGKGRAIIVADADFLNTPALGPEAQHNLDALMEMLASLAAS